MILLDSHVLLWVLSGRGALGGKARTLLEGSEGVHVSAASIWELTIKSMLGKVRVPHDLVDKLEPQGLLTLDVTAQHAAAIRDFPELAAHDPFDRLLVAQASRDGLRLLTADRILLGLGRRFVVDATV